MEISQQNLPEISIVIYQVLHRLMPVSMVFVQQRECTNIFYHRQCISDSLRFEGKSHYIDQ